MYKLTILPLFTFICLQSPTLTHNGDLSHSALNKLIQHTDIELIADHFGPLLNLSIPDRSGNTLLHNAAYGGRVELVTSLLQLGANLEQENLYGVTPLQLAIAAGHEEVIDVFIEHGARVGNVCTVKETGIGDSSEIGDDDYQLSCSISETQSETSTCSRNQSKEWLQYTRWSQYLASNWIVPEEGERILQELPECSCALPVSAVCVCILFVA